MPILVTVALVLAFSSPLLLTLLVRSPAIALASAALSRLSGGVGRGELVIKVPLRICLSLTCPNNAQQAASLPEKTAFFWSCGYTIKGMLKSQLEDHLRQNIRQALAVAGARTEVALTITVDAIVVLLSLAPGLDTPASQQLLVSMLSSLFQAQQLDQALPLNPAAVAACDAAAVQQATALRGLICDLQQTLADKPPGEAS